MDTPFTLIFQLSQNGATEEWRANLTVFHRIADIIQFYRIQRDDSSSTITFSHGGNYDTSPQSLIGNVLGLGFVTPLLEFKSDIILHVGQSSANQPVECPVMVHISTIDGTIIQHLAQLSDSIHHLKKDISEDGKAKFTHIGRIIEDEALTIGEILKIDVAPLFTIDLQLLDGEVQIEDFFEAPLKFEGEAYLEVKANTGLRVHQAKSILQNVIGDDGSFKFYCRNREMLDHTTLGSVFNSESLHTIHVRSTNTQMAHIRPTDFAQKTKYVFEGIELKESQCFVVDNVGEEPYLVVNESGVNKFIKSGVILQKVRVNYKPTPTVRERNIRLEEENADVSFVAEVVQPARHDPEVAQQIQDMVQLGVLFMLGVIASFAYLELQTFTTILKVTAIIHSPMLFFGNSLADGIEGFFARYRLQFLQLLSKGYCFLLRMLNQAADIPLNALIRFCVKRKYDFQIVFEEEEKGTNIMIIRKSIDTVNEFVKNTVLLIVTILPSKVAELEKAIESRRKEELHYLWVDLTAHHHRLKSATLLYEQKFGDEKRMHETLEDYRLDLVDLVRSSESLDEDDLFIDGIKYYRSAAKYRQQLLECVAEDRPLPEEIDAEEVDPANTAEIMEADQVGSADARNDSADE